MTSPDDRAAPPPAETPAAADASGEGGRWVTTRIDRSRFRTSVEARSHRLELDEPAAVGGTDSGATPYEALLGALGGCTAMTLRMYADRKQWPLEGVEVRLRQSRTHESDCEICDTDAVGPHTVERQIELRGPLTEEQHRRLMQIADRCPVKQALERGLRVVVAAS